MARRRFGSPCLEAGICMLAGVFLCGRAVRAEFAEPVTVTDSGGEATATALSLDPANNIFIASAVGGGLEIDLIGPNLRVDFEVPEAEGERGEPDIVTNSRGGSFLVFTQVRPSGARDVFITSNTAGPVFSAPRDLSDSEQVDDREPQVATDLGGDPHVVWTAGGTGEGSAARVMYHDGTDTLEVARGRKPSLGFDQQGRAHVVWIHEEAVWWSVLESGTFGEPQKVVTAPSAEGLAARVAVDEFGNVLVPYTSEGTLYFVTRSGEGEANAFLPPRFVDRGEVLDPELRVRSGGVITIVYTKEGEPRVVQGISDFLLEPEDVLEEPGEGESSTPDVLVDACGNLHVAWLRGGEVLYSNNAAEVQADFTASPPGGEGPLTVEFQDLSNGKVQVWNWDFGDETHSNLPNPTHTYEAPGKYTVSLTVFNADRESTVVKEDFITVQESSNVLEVPDQVVLPDQRDVWFPVRASHADPIQGFQVHALYDPNVMTLKDCSLDATVVEALNPDVWECNFGERNVEIGVIFELEPPFLNPELPPGEQQTLVQLIFDISNGAPSGTAQLRLTNNRELSRIFNIFTVSGFTKLPVLKSSRVTVLNPFEPPFPRLFVRGDADGSGGVDITDAIVILNFLFTGGVEPACMDAADVRDMGRVDISAPITLLNYLFLGGSPPAVPFPNAGIDPTEDEHPPCD